jgi:hypothetical protein
VTTTQWGMPVLLILLSVLISCDRQEVIADPNAAMWRSIDLRADRFESLSFGVGSGLHGLDLTIIRADRTVSAKRRSENGWLLSTGKLSDAELNLLIKGLQESGVLRLESKYISSLQDGTQTCCVLATTDGVKHVYSSNVELSPLRKVEKVVNDILGRILEDGRASISKEASEAMEAPIWSAIEK